MKFDAANASTVVELRSSMSRNCAAMAVGALQKLIFSLTTLIIAKHSRALAQEYAQLALGTGGNVANVERE